jgi:hypothetical protein
VNEDLQAAEQGERARWGSDTSSSAGWDAAELVRQLRRAGEADRAVRFAEDATGHWPEFGPLASALAWALYTRDLGSLTAEAARPARAAGLAAVDRIEQLNANDPYGTYAAWPTAVLKLASTIERWPRAQLDLLHRLDPARLSDDRSGEYRAARTRWYLGCTKALQKLGRWGELLGMCEQALETLQLQADERGWLERRRGLALAGIGPGRGARDARVLPPCPGRLVRGRRPRQGPGRSRS